MDKIRLAGLIGIMILAFVLGRLSVEKDVEVVKSDVKVADEIKTHTVTTTVRGPACELRTTTVTDSTEQIKAEIKTEDKAVKVATGKALNLSLMVSPNFSHLDNPLTYGVSITKELFGPITVGLFGLTNGTIGATIGVNF